MVPSYSAPAMFYYKIMGVLLNERLEKDSVHS
jgi:hypothetical protein